MTMIEELKKGYDLCGIKYIEQLNSLIVSLTEEIPILQLKTTFDEKGKYLFTSLIVKR